MFKMGKDTLGGFGVFGFFFYFPLIDDTPWPFPDVEIVLFFFFVLK